VSLGTRLLASEEKATKRPPAETDGLDEPPMPQPTPAGLTLTSVFFCVATS
jgi:hypothetical protein